VHSRGIPVHLKTIAMRGNVHELDQMRGYAEARGWYFWFDARIVPVRDGNLRVLAERLSPEETVALDLADPDRREGWGELRERGPGKSQGQRIFACTAGAVAAYITSEGALTPCALVLSRQWPLDASDLRGSLRRAFYDELPRAMAEQAQGDFPCGECELTHLCRACAGWRELEEGAVERPCLHGCEVALLRAQAFGAPGVPPPLRARCDHPGAES